MNALHDILTHHEAQIAKLCVQYRVSVLYVFGSVVDGRFSEETSDIDFLVRFVPEVPLEKVGALLLALEEALERLFQRKIDLVRERPFTNPIFAKSVADTKRMVYAAA